MAKLTTPPCTESQPASAWIIRHSDLHHEGSRETCDHCQLMIHYYGPMPPVEELRAALRAEHAQKRRDTYQKAPIPEALRWAVWERDNFTCQHCGTRRNLSVDHVVPESKGGPTTLDNCRTLCSTCNSRKGAR